LHLLYFASCKTSFQEISLTLQVLNTITPEQNKSRCSDENQQWITFVCHPGENTNTPLHPSKCMGGLQTNLCSFGFVKNFTQMQIKIKIKILLRIPWLLENNRHTLI
jgi:hypothetical protein